MPLERIHAVLQATDLSTRNELISAHLASLEENLARTQSAVASLRGLLADPSPAAPVTHRRVAATHAAAITAVVAMADFVPWYLGAIGELQATLDARGVRATGPAAGIYAEEFFADEQGAATVFLPTAASIRPLGRIEPLVVPAAEFAVIVHQGALDLDRSYGALATHVANQTLRVDGLIREYYLIGRQDTADESAWRTEICWPVFSTGASEQER